MQTVKTGLYLLPSGQLNVLVKTRSKHHHHLVNDWKTWA